MHRATRGEHYQDHGRLADARHSYPQEPQARGSRGDDGHPRDRLERRARRRHDRQAGGPELRLDFLARGSRPREHARRLSHNPDLCRGLGLRHPRLAARRASDDKARQEVYGPDARENRLPPRRIPSLDEARGYRAVVASLGGCSRSRSVGIRHPTRRFHPLCVACRR